MGVLRVGLGGAREQLEGAVDLAARRGDRSRQAQDLGVVGIVTPCLLQAGLGAAHVARLEQLPAAFDRIARRRGHGATISRYSPSVDERRRIGVRWIALLLAVLVIGCPGRTKRKVGPDLTVPTNGNQQALRQFEETRARFKSGGEKADAEQKSQVATEFEKIARDYPQDPIAPHARLYA